MRGLMMHTDDVMKELRHPWPKYVHWYVLGENRERLNQHLLMITLANKIFKLRWPEKRAETAFVLARSDVCAQGWLRPGTCAGAIADNSAGS
jgi:hypothetical protein